MINKDFFEALADLEKEKGVNRDLIIETLQNALASAYKKQHVGENGEVEVKLDPETNTMRCFNIKKVVSDEAEEIDRNCELTVEDAQEFKPGAKEGDVIVVEFTPKDFGRIAAQTAKQVILQKLRETERDNTLSVFSDKEGELMEGVIRKIDTRRNVYVEIGNEQIEGLMLPSDQVNGEKYTIGSTIKVFVKKVKNGVRSAQVYVSRSNPGLVKRLFEEQVPEIKQGQVIVKGISREAGSRSKMAIYSEDPRIDAVGSCVGARGARVNAIVSELGGEKIDIILWSENPLEFISKALSPAPVLSVTQLDGEKCAMAVVPDDKLSLAIGRDGQNARLAARLTGWKIDVKSQSVYEKMIANGEIVLNDGSDDEEEPEAETEIVEEEAAPAEEKTEEAAEETPSAEENNSDTEGVEKE